MTNLLQANLSRLVRSRAFLLALLAEIAYTALIILVCWDQYADGGYFYTLESVLSSGFALMGYLPVPALIAAPLLCVHLGTEYSDHTLRNKLIVGHTRRSIYLADLLCCVTVTVSLDVLYLAAASAFCVYPVIGMAGRLLRVSPGQMLAWVLAGLLARAAWVSGVKLLTVVLGNKTTAAIAELLLIVAASAFCAYGFHELEYLARNTAAVDREQRMIFWQLALDTLPTGQYLQVSRLDTPNLWRLPLLSLGIFAAGTGAGLALFQRKDLK